LPEEIRKSGGQPLMWKTGHSLLKNKIKETGAPLGGEMSGHIFINDKFPGYDDAVYVSARLLEIISQSDKKISAYLDGVTPYHSTPEIRVECASDQDKFEITRKAVAYFKENYEVIDVDGVRIQFGDGWGLVRASNTQPVIVVRFEAQTPERLAEIQSLVVGKLKEFGEVKI
ncbi:MAG: phosphomannomutase, partial [Calditrichaeota bacterium]|nr:phosphomannomutase [Calditrichota bacterium]